MSLTTDPEHVVSVPTATKVQEQVRSTSRSQKTAPQTVPATGTTSRPRKIDRQAAPAASTTRPRTTDHQPAPATLTSRSRRTDQQAAPATSGM